MPRISRLWALKALILMSYACSSGDSGTNPDGTPKPVANVQLSTNAATLQLGRTVTLTATAKAADGSTLAGRTVAWTTSAPTVATVSNAGVVTTLALGEADITATSEGKTASAHITVQPVAVASVAISTANFVVKLNETQQLTATARDDQNAVLADRAVTWTTSNPAVATVSNAGVVTGIDGGEADITATSEGKSAVAHVTVQIPVARVQIVGALDTLEAFDVKNLQAITYDAQNRVLAGRTITWTTSNAAVATPDNATQQLTGVDRGTVTITATSEGKSATATRVVVIKYRSITAGTMHACDLASGGLAYCWGLNGQEARLGSATVGDGVFQSQPFLVPGGHRFVQLATFARTTCGLELDGDAFCWGYNGWGTLGANSNLAFSATPLPVAGNHKFSQLAAGTDHACGLEAGTGAIWCWGNNDWRELGTGNSTITSVPVAANTNVRFSAIGAGAGFTCGVQAGTGAAYCWGANQIGQVGDGGAISYGNTFVALPQAVAGGRAFRSIALGSQYTCGVTTANQAYCWGSNNGKLGNNGNDSSTPVAVSGGLQFATVSAGYAHACGVTQTEEIWCWGNNGYGQLGNAIQNGSAVPVRAGGTLKGVEVAAAGIGTGSAGHTCAISADRLTAYCWGRNDVGQLGNGATTQPSTVNATPVIIVGQKPL